MQIDKAGRLYWDQAWHRSSLPAGVDPEIPGVQNYVNREFHRYFFHAFAGMNPQGKRLLEVGCARSAWLPYFAREFGFSISGIDYSELGCRQAAEVLAREGIEGEIVCADLFEPPEKLRGAMDVAVSFGVVEHFEDTAGCVRAISDLVAPGGTVITSIPNLTGWIGSVQKWVDSETYSKHVPLNREALLQAHEQAGLEVLTCEYFLFTNFGINNLNGVTSPTLGRFAKSVALALLGRLSMLLWMVDSRAGRLKPNRTTSPYVICLARKPEGSA